MKQIYLWASALCLALTAPLTANAQLQLVNESVVNAENEPAPVHPVPAPRQLKWQRTEFYAFFQYGSCQHLKATPDTPFYCLQHIFC